MFSDLAQLFSDILVVKMENLPTTSCLSEELDIIGTIGLQAKLIPVNQKTLISKMYYRMRIERHFFDNDTYI